MQKAVSRKNTGYVTSTSVEGHFRPPKASSTLAIIVAVSRRIRRLQSPMWTGLKPRCI